MTLGGDVTYDSTNNPLGATISGNLNLGTAARTMTVGDSASATADLAISADITGTLGLIKEGTGTLALSGNNVAATGGMTINAGAVQFDSAASINGTAKDVTVNADGTVMFSASFGAANIPTALVDRIVATSAGTIAADNYDTTAFDFNTPGLTAIALGAVGEVTYTGTLTPNGTTYRLGGGGGTLIMANANAVTGAGNSLIVKGPGTVALANSNDYDGTTTVLAGGTLQIGDGGTAGSLNTASAITVDGNLTANRSDTLTQGTDFATGIAGSGSVTQAGTGTLVLNSANTYTGETTVTAGTLQLTHADAIGSSSGLTLSGGTLQADTAINLNGLTLNTVNQTVTQRQRPELRRRLDDHHVRDRCDAPGAHHRCTGHRFHGQVGHQQWFPEA